MNKIRNYILNGKGIAAKYLAILSLILTIVITIFFSIIIMLLRKDRCCPDKNRRDKNRKRRYCQSREATYPGCICLRRQYATATDY